MKESKKEELNSIDEVNLIFKNYNMLIGPLNNPSQIGSFIDPSHIKIFTQNPTAFPKELKPISYELNHQTKFNTILEQLPINWKPDIVIWWDLIYQAIPPDIEECPYPIAVILGDWFNQFETVYRYINAFDFVLTDKRCLQALHKIGFKQCDYWPCWSFNPELFESIPKQQRIYDVSFIGSWNHAIHQKRSHLLEKIALLSDRYKIRIDGGVFGDEYVKILKQSKIVFNHSVYQGMNLRAYEAPAAGALLFMEEQNLEIRDFLPDRVGCVLYNDSNLEELLYYYLQNEEERKQISNKGYQLIQQHSYEKQFERLLTLTPKIIEQAKKSTRTFSLLSPEEKALIVTKQIFHSDSEQGKEHGIAIQYLLNSANLSDWKVINALVVMVLSSSDYTEQFSANIQNLINQLQIQYPDYPLSYLFLAELKDKNKNYSEAILCLHHCIKSLTNKSIGFNDQLFGFVFIHGYDSVHMEWQRFMINNAQNRHLYNEAIRDLLTDYCWLKIGRLELLSDHYDKALNVLQQVVSNEMLKKEAALLMARTFQKKGDFKNSIDLYREVIEKIPFAFEEWELFINILLHAQKFQEANELINRLQNICKISPQLYDLQKRLELLKEYPLKTGKNIVNPEIWTDS